MDSKVRRKSGGVRMSGYGWRYINEEVGTVLCAALVGPKNHALSRESHERSPSKEPRSCAYAKLRASMSTTL